MRKTILLSTLLLSFSCAASSDMLSAWNDTPAKQAIEKWVQDATREGSPDFCLANVEMSYLKPS
jgi:hypothetical protein